MAFSRVHISSRTLEFLGDAFEVEDGDGGSRDSFLKENNVKTYLIKTMVSDVFSLFATSVHFWHDWLYCWKARRNIVFKSLESMWRNIHVCYDPIHNLDSICNLDSIRNHDPIRNLDPIRNRDPICNLELIRNLDPMRNLDPIRNRWHSLDTKT